MQSIQLLQMTHFELTQFIAQEVEKNPLLEFAPMKAMSSIAGRGSRARARDAGADERRATPSGEATGSSRAPAMPSALTSSWTPISKTSFRTTPDRSAPTRLN